MTNSLSREERLRGDKRITRLFTTGKHGFAHPFRYYYSIGESDGQGGEGASKGLVAVMFSVPKKNFKRAVKRNLLRRRTKEAYRLNKSLITIPAGGKGRTVDIALVYSVKDAADYKTIENGVKQILAAVKKNL